MSGPPKIREVDVEIAKVATPIYLWLLERADEVSPDDFEAAVESRARTATYHARKILQAVMRSRRKRMEEYERKRMEEYE